MLAEPLARALELLRAVSKPERMVYQIASQVLREQELDEALYEPLVIALFEALP
jgi:hypothetical protein